MDEIDIDEPLVRSLLREQHADLADQPLRLMPGGWDNQMWRLGEDLAVRLPRTPRAPDLLRKEQRWLPGLASRLPLPIPTPVRSGEPSDRFPWPWVVTEWVPGEPGDSTPITRGHHAAAGLAEFLSALHQEAPSELSSNSTRSVSLKHHADVFDTRLQALAAPVDTTALRAVWDDAVRAPEWQRPPTWVHGDLHPANAVITEGTLAGIIDFGELCAGDPSTDLAAAWTLLPIGSASRFFNAYGESNASPPVDAATMRRARGWAILRALVLMEIGEAWERGLPGGKETWGAVGRATLDRVLAEGG